MVKRIFLLLCAVLTVSVFKSAPAQPAQPVVFYASINAKELENIVGLFERLHPEITVQPVRMTSELIPPRIVTAQRAGRFDVDVISAGPVDTAELAAAGALQRYTYPDRRSFLAGTVDPNGLWSALYIGTTVIAWNTARLQAENARPPLALADLGQPRWNGKIGLDSAAFTWYLGALQGDAAVQTVMDGIARNKPLLVSSHSLVLSQLASGEFEVTPTAYGYLADLAKRAGQPVDFINPSPLIFQLSTIALAKNAPNPGPSKVFIDWLLSRQAQQLLASPRGGDFCSPRSDVPGNPALCNQALPHVIVGPQSAKRLDEVVRQFKTTFGVLN